MRYYFQVGNYGESHDNLFKFMYRFIKKIVNSDISITIDLFKDKFIKISIKF